MEAVPLPLLVVVGFAAVKLAAPPSMPSPSSSESESSETAAFAATAGVIPGPSAILEVLLFLRRLLEGSNSSGSHPLRAAATAKVKPARAAAIETPATTAEDEFDGLILDE